MRVHTREIRPSVCRRRRSRMTSFLLISPVSVAALEVSHRWIPMCVTRFHDSNCMPTCSNNFASLGGGSRPPVGRGGGPAGGRAGKGRRRQTAAAGRDAGLPIKKIPPVNGFPIPRVGGGGAAAAGCDEGRGGTGRSAVARYRYMSENA
jgi:hypothetical protein